MNGTGLALRYWFHAMFSSSSQLSRFCKEARRGGATWAETAEMWDFAHKTAGAYWHVIRRDGGHLLQRAGLAGALAVARSEIDWAFLSYNRVDIYQERGYSLGGSHGYSFFGYLDAIEMSRSGVPYEYAVAGRGLPAAEIIRAWRSEVPAEYLEALAA